MRDRFSTLLVEHAENLRPDLTALVDRLGELSPTALEDPNELNDLLGDTGFGADVDAPQARRLREELATLSAVLVGYAQWATDAVVSRVIGARRPVAEAMRRRLVEMTEDERAAERLFGLDLSAETVDRGEAFVSGVLERGGASELAKLWIADANLPTPAELDAPGLWIALGEPVILNRRDQEVRLGALGLFLFFWDAEVPFQQNVLPLGVADDPLAIATELRVVGREKHQPGERTFAERLDDGALAELRFHLPMGRDRSEVDDAHMRPWRFRSRVVLRHRHGHRLLLRSAAEV